MYSKLVFLFLVATINSVVSTPCARVESVDISTGISYENGSVVHDGIEYVQGNWYEVEEDDQMIRLGCPCVGRTCVWKCCGDGQMFFERTCNYTDAAEVNPFSPTLYKGIVPTEANANQKFHYMYNRLCTSRYLVDPLLSHEFYIQENATLYEISYGRHQWHAPTMYCVDMMQTNQTLRAVAVVCHPVVVDDDPILYIAYAVGLLLSVPFLLATFLVYAFISELRNLHGMCLMAYCSGLIVAYPLLAYMKLQVIDNIAVDNVGCWVIAFIIYYAFQSSFFWLNVMCFDIWRTFSGYRGGSSNKGRDCKRFILYSMYAWGVPAVLTSITIGMEFSTSLPDNVIRPNFGDKRCWFEDWTGEMLYFYTPVLVLVVCNVVLFSVTAHRIRSIRQETAILKSSDSSRSDKLKRDKQRYGLYLKLFVVMGVNWSVEVISFVLGGTNWYWVITDLSNIALGLFIFFTFVWKAKVRNLVRKKIAKWRGLPGEGFSESAASRWATRSSTAATETTRINSSDEAGIRLKDMR